MLHFYQQPFQMVIRIAGSALLACLLWAGSLSLGTSSVQADEYSDSLRGSNLSGPGSSSDYGQFRPSFKPSFDSDVQRRQELANRQAQDWRDEAQRQYRSTLSPSFGPSGDQSRFNYSENVQTPDGSWMSCAKGGSGTTYCYKP